MAGAVLSVVMLTAACASDQDNVDRDIEQVADEARSLIDELAAQVGTEPEVRQDTITDCVPGDSDSGKDLIYTVRVKVPGDASTRLRDDVAPAYEADGWTVRLRGDTDLQLRRDNVTMGVTVFPDDGLAAVSGTGGCVR